MNRVVKGLLVALLVAVVAAAGYRILSSMGVAPPITSSLSPKTKINPKNKNAYLTKDDPTLRTTDIGSRKWKIIDIHEHANGEVEALQLIKAMDKLGIQRTALMASTTYTLTLNPIYGFEGFKENSEAIIAIKKKWPDRFSAFVTFDPCSGDDNFALVKDWVARGADGVKLYLGHGASTPKFAFHCQPLNHPNLDSFYAWAEDVQLPILMHVNLEKYWDEMLDVLEKHPYLRVTLPHFGLHKNTEQRLKRLGFLLDRYPYVFTDISFGYYTFQIDGFEVLAKFRSRSREFLAKHRDKVMFASDMVLEPSKDEAYIDDTLRSYLQFLEMERWRFFLVPSETMHGMGLDDETLKHIYEVAPSSFLLLDSYSMSPDRTKDPRVEVARHPLPPLDRATIPALKLGSPTSPPVGADNKSAGCEHEG
jgi:predicted TIM-barrel fold metal-dependent hydrolase